MNVELGADGFPKKGLSKKKQRQWLASNPRASEYHFYLSQAAAFHRSSLRWLVVSVGGLGVSFLAQLVLIALRAVS